LLPTGCSVYTRIKKQTKWEATSTGTRWGRHSWKCKWVYDTTDWLEFRNMFLWQHCKSFL